MPKSAFNAIENNISNILGGARVALVENKENASDIDAEKADKITFLLEVDSSCYHFIAQRDHLAFTETVTFPRNCGQSEKLLKQHQEDWHGFEEETLFP
jgi:hypothetical protein